MSRVAWGALALAAVVAIALALPNLRDVWNGGPPPVAERDAGPPVPEPESPEREAVARAAALRDEAAHECDQERWRECEQSLDEARNIDPGGESREDVMSMRQGIARAGRPLEQKAPPRAWPAPSPSTTRLPSQDRRHLDTKPGLSP